MFGFEDIQTLDQGKEHMGSLWNCVDQHESDHEE